MSENNSEGARDWCEIATSQATSQENPEALHYVSEFFQEEMHQEFLDANSP